MEGIADAWNRTDLFGIINGLHDVFVMRQQPLLLASHAVILYRVTCLAQARPAQQGTAPFWGCWRAALRTLSDMAYLNLAQMADRND
jgi:hypothetical protein